VRYRQALLLLPALAATYTVHAETQYVIEQLVVNVNSAPDASGQRVATIKSGEAVEVLDKQGDQIHVHLANGTEGWVRKSYLSVEEPLQHRLNERNAEVEKLKQDVARLEGELATARGGGHGGKTATAAGDGAPSGGARTSAAARAVETNSAQSDAANGEPTYFMTPPDTPARPVWHWALLTFVIALGLGFVLGWQVLDRRIRKKYGGLRIY
jgi:SH3 domain-containing protein